MLLRADLEETIDRMRDLTSGKVVLNSDDLFRILPRYLAHPEERMVLGPLLYPKARDFTDEIYARLLTRPFRENDTVVFTAGGSATGKSSILRSAGGNPGRFHRRHHVLQCSPRSRSGGPCACFRAEGRNSLRLSRVPESIAGMIHRALDRKSGRIVPIDDMARTHFGAQRALLDAMNEYEDDPRVSIFLLENASGKLRPLSASRFAELLHESVDALVKLGQAVLDEFRHSESGRRHPEGPDHDPGGDDLHFSEAFYEAARSKTQGRGKSAGEGDAEAL